MPSLSERERNNVRAGVFVTISLIACMAVIIALTNVADAWFHKTSSYMVTFPVTSGVANLKKGSEVRVGGVPMGRVVEVIAPFDKDGAFRTIGVEFNLDQKIALYQNATIVLGVPVLGNDAWLDIPNVGDAAAPLSSDRQIKGTPSVGLITTLVGSENAGEVDELVANVKEFSRFARDFKQEYNQRYVPIIDNLDATVVDIKSMVAELHERHWPNWTQAVTEVMAWATEATIKIDAALDAGTGFFNEGQGVLTDNRANVQNIVTNVKATSQRLNETTIQQVEEFFNSGQKAVDAARPVLEMMRDDYPKWSAEVGSALANANMASQQLKLTTIEARRAPWKLLYRPTTDEVEHELLYDAVRSFALAAGELRVTSEAVKRILDTHGEKVGADESVYRRLEKMLTDDLADYEKAQQKMLEVLMIDGKR